MQVKASTEESAWGCVKVLLALFVGAPLVVAVIRGWATAKLWGWFIVPVFTGAPALTLVRAIGIAMALSLLTYRYTAYKGLERDETGEWVVALIARLEARARAGLARAPGATRRAPHGPEPRTDVTDLMSAENIHVWSESRFEWLQVETPDGKFPFARGDEHTADDIAAAAVRRFWKGKEPRACAVMDRAGRCLRHNPTAFKAAATAYVGRPGQSPC